MGDLTFGPELEFLPSQPKPTNKTLRILDSYLPDFFEPMDTPTGLQTSSIHFAHGAIRGMPLGASIYLHARATGDMPTIAEADRLSIVSGICMFGKSGLKSYGPEMVPTILERPGISSRQDTKPVIEVQRGEQQIYVPESIARLGRVMIALTQYASQHRKPTDIFIHIPGPEYKIQAEVMFAAGKLTLRALQQYYELIDSEAKNIQIQFSDLFEAFGSEVPVFGSPLDTVLDEVEAGSLNPDHFRGTTFQPLIDDVTTMMNALPASYVTAYARACKTGSLPIFVDDFAEEHIYKATKRVPNFMGLALYPLSICVSQQANSLLYHNGASDAEIAKAVAPWIQ